MIAELYYDREMSEQEIAEMFEIHRKRVSQILKQVKKEIAQAAVLEERLADYKDDPDASKLEVTWIKF